MNTVQLVGRLTREVELRYTANGVAVGTFTLAVNRNFTNQQGEREADFISCVIWRKSAENLANFTRKGSQIGITGRIQTRNYENQQGQRVYVTEVVADNFYLLEPRSVTEQRPVGDSNQANQAGASPQQNYQNNYQNNYAQNQQQGSNAKQSFGQTINETTNNDNSNDFSFNQNMGNSSPFGNDTQAVDISEDDLPF